MTEARDTLDKACRAFARTRGQLVGEHKPEDLTRKLKAHETATRALFEAAVGLVEAESVQPVSETA